jgi:NADPH:quinone reductase-like Zn-dependent oxidoreductase
VRAVRFDRYGDLDAGTTAYAAVRAVAPRPGERVVVSGAAGGVGSIAVQLARRGGANVIGIVEQRHTRGKIVLGP